MELSAVGSKKGKLHKTEHDVIRLTVQGGTVLRGVLHWTTFLYCVLDSPVNKERGG